MQLYRQGDVLIAAVDSIPADAIKREGLVLLAGERSGHAHRLETRGLAEVLQHQDDLYVRLAGTDARIVHDEHAAITLPMGMYHVWRQREYAPRREGGDRWIED